MPRLPLWYILRSLLWEALLVWIMVMVGRQLIRSSQWPTNWKDGAGASIVLVLAVSVGVWFWVVVGKAIQRAEGGGKKKAR